MAIPCRRLKTVNYDNTYKRLLNTVEGNWSYFQQTLAAINSTCGKFNSQLIDVLLPIPAGIEPDETRKGPRENSVL
ncbi:unnamed protein product, partial [Dicrocoelium dendriticum]